MASTLRDNLTKIQEEIDAKILPEDIRAGKVIFGVTGTMEQGVGTADATATAADILVGQTAYVQEQKITGTMPDNGILTYTPGDNALSIPMGYTDGGSISAVNITSLSEYKACDTLASEIIEIGGII